MYDQPPILTLTLIQCCQQPVMALQLPDGPIAAAVQSFCEALDLDRFGQLQRIRRQPVLAEQLRRITVMTPSGRQEVDVLAVNAIPAWLIGIQLNRLAPEKRTLILDFQREAVDTLYRHFFKVGAQQSAPPAPKRPEAPARSPWQMLHEAIDAIHQELEATEEVQRAMGDHVVALEADVAALKARPAGSVAQERGQQPGNRILSSEHLVQMYVLARWLHQRTGAPIGALLGELAKSFGVADASDLPDAAWDAVLAWFWQQQAGG